MASYSCIFKGYKRIIHQRTKDNPGKKAIFVNGRFDTDDPEIIRVLDAICLKNSAEMQRIDKSLEIIEKIRKVIPQKEKIKISDVEEKVFIPKDANMPKPQIKRKKRRK